MQPVFKLDSLSCFQNPVQYPHPHAHIWLLYFNAGLKSQMICPGPPRETVFRPCSATAVFGAVTAMCQCQEPNSTTLFWCIWKWHQPVSLFSPLWCPCSPHLSVSCAQNDNGSYKKISHAKGLKGCLWVKDCHWLPSLWTILEIMGNVVLGIHRQRLPVFTVVDASNLSTEVILWSSRGLCTSWI